ncbi:hypothetical protein TMP248_530004 [Tenacibaculum maritimum]|nr:hypothetical protein TMP248_530004 [Tenacibaculum maritimum]
MPLLQRPWSPDGRTLMHPDESGATAPNLYKKDFTKKRLIQVFLTLFLCSFFYTTRAFKNEKQVIPLMVENPRTANLFLNH